MDVKEKLLDLLTDNLPRIGNLPKCDNPLQYTINEIVERIADHLISNGVTVQEWISVDDRLPEPKHEFDARNWYLVALSNDVVKELAYEFHNHSVFGYGWRETAYPVTHWMPLPQPPKGE